MKLFQVLLLLRLGHWFSAQFAKFDVSFAVCLVCNVVRSGDIPLATQQETAGQNSGRKQDYPLGNNRSPVYASLGSWLRFHHSCQIDARMFDDFQLDSTVT